MKKLDFHSTPRGAEFYTLLYDGLTTTGRSFEAPGETRVIGKVFTALEAVGRPATRNKDTQFQFESYDLNGKRAVLLEENEYALARDALAKRDGTRAPHARSRR